MEHSPHEISARLTDMAGQYRLYANEYAKLQGSHAVRWLEIRKTTDTNRAADMYLAATPEGQREAELKYLMRGLEKEMSALRAHLRVLDVFGN